MSTVGIVVVSHSRVLADAAVALAREMLHGTEPRIAVAAGLDETTFGTDAVAIVSAIEQVDSPAGVVVLMDLGSAVLSAELALDLLEDPDVRDRVLLSPAPLVEGLVVGAVAAAGGAGRQEVAAEARSALLAKSTALGSADPVPDLPPVQSDPGEHAVTGEFTVRNPHGLHARPAARLVAQLQPLQATVTLRNATTGGDWVPASSLSRVAALGAQAGHLVQVSATGPQAPAALAQLHALAERLFDELDDAPAAAVPRPSPSADRPGGTPQPVSPGIGTGPARQLVPHPVPVDDVPAGSPEHQRHRLDDALDQVQRHIEQLAAPGGVPGDVFGAHLMLLRDAALLGASRGRIEDGASAARAWADAAAAIEQQLAGLPDPYLRERAADVRAVADDVLRVLAGQPVGAPPPGDGVLVTVDLTPAQAAGLDRGRVPAVVLAAGSPTSHASILLRATGIPAIAAAGAGVLDIADGTPLVVDGTAGRLLVDPDSDQFPRPELPTTE